MTGNKMRDDMQLRGHRTQPLYMESTLYQLSCHGTPEHYTLSLKDDDHTIDERTLRALDVK